MQPLLKQVPINIQSRKNPLLALQDEINKVMGEFYNVIDFPHASALERFEGLNITPAIDVIDSKDNYKLEIEMPGMDEKDIKVTIGDGILSIKGEKSVSKKDKDKNYVMREISYGYFKRDIPLPDSVDASKAEASFKKGMLWVVMPKKAESTKQYRELSVQKAKE